MNTVLNEFLDDASVYKASIEEIRNYFEFSMYDNNILLIVSNQTFLKDISEYYFTENVIRNVFRCTVDDYYNSFIAAITMRLKYKKMLLAIL